MMTIDTVLAAAEGFVSADLEGETVLLDTQSGTYYGLNQVGARIMDLLKKPQSVSVLIDSMLQEYEVNDEQLRQDLMTFLQEMTAHQLIHVQDEATT